MAKNLTPEELEKARNRLSAGRIRAMEKAPYFSTALLSLEPREIVGFGTFAVDQKWRMYYDPAKCLEWSIDEIATVWIHEISHVIRNHSARFKATGDSSQYSEYFNAAADAAINYDLREMDMVLPNPETRYYAEPNAQYPTWRVGMTAEEMYRIARGKSGEKVLPDDSGASDDSGDSDSQQEDDESQEMSDETEDDEGINENSDEDSSDDEDSSEDEDSKSQNSDNDDSDTEDSDENLDVEQDDEDGLSDGDSDSDSDESDDPLDDENLDVDSESDDYSDFSPDTMENEEPEEASDPNESSDSDNDSDSDSDSQNDADSDTDSDSDSDSHEGSESESGSPKSDSNGAEDQPSDESAHSEGNCGSGAHGVPQDYEVDDGSGLDPMEAEQMRRETAQEIEAYNDRYGNVPGGLLREAKEILDPKVDWTEEFLEVIRKEVASIVGQNDYSYARPSRRGAQTPFILPSMRDAPPPEIVIILDTSGSMSVNKELAQALGEMEDIVDRAARYSSLGGIRVINCDAGANAAVIVSDINDFEIVGGGGTDMRVGIKAAAELLPKAGIIIILTDGGTPWPKMPPEDNEDALYIALIIETRKTSQGHFWSTTGIPDWMHVIEVNTND